MKKMGMAALAGALVLASATAGIAGPNVGGKNFNIQARSIHRDMVDARNAMYAKTGTPKLVSNWRWERSDLGPVYNQQAGHTALVRVPAKR